MLFSSGASALALLSFAAQVLGQTCPRTARWVPCTGAAGFDCTTIQVPYDWDKKADGRVIDLKLIRVRADGDYDNAQSILINPGGPGQSGIDFVLKGGLWAQQRAGGIYNIIGWDPRGVGLNMPYYCDPTNRGWGYAPVDGKAETVANYWTKSAESYLAGAKECAVDNRQDKSVVDTINTAFDVHAIAQAIKGDKQIRYWGFSYGTLLGNVIARIFPDWIDRMMLDGNIDPDSYYFGSSEVEASDVVRAVQQFFRLCSQATGNNCAWTALTGQNNNYNDLLSKYDNWVGISPLNFDTRGRTSTLTNDQSFFIRALVHGALKAPKKYKKLAQILQEWYDYPANIRSLSGEGNDIENYVLRSGSSRVRRQEINRNFDPNDALTTNNAKAKNALSGIRCIDLDRSMRVPTADNYQKWYTALANKNYYSGDTSVSYIFNCAPWQMTSSYGFNDGKWASKGKIPTRQPILFIQTYYDTVTPQQSAVNAASYYRDAGLVYTEGVGHCSNVNPSDQLYSYIKSYWANPGKAPSMPPALGNNGQPLTLAVNVKNVFDRSPDDPVPVEQVVQTGQVQGSPAKRDLSYLFQGVPLTPHKRSFNFMIRRDNNTIATNDTVQSTPTDSDFEYEACPDDTTNSTTTASTSSATATSTGYNGTTTAASTGTYTGTSTSAFSGTSTGTYTGTSTSISTGTSTGTSIDATFTPITPIDDSDVAWNFWTPGQAATTAASTWTVWDPKKSSTTPAPTGTWGPWSSKGSSGSWEAWTSQDDSVPVTKTVCNGGKGCSTIVVAVPTKTVYIDYFTDVCETGITTKTATITATCAKGCVSKPTGVPDGYTTKNVYCSACATPSSILVTVTVSKPSEWANADPISSAKKTGVDATFATWSGASGTPTSQGSKPTSGAAGDDWTNWSNAAGSATGVGASSAWGTWADATATGPKVAKYTGAASTNDISMRGSIFAAVLAGLWFL